MVLTTSLLTQTRTDIKTALGVNLTDGAVGTGSTTPAASDTVLDTEVFRSVRDEFDTSVADSITASLRILTTEANNNAIRETGWWSGGTLSVDNCDATTGWTDSADMTVSLNNTTYVEGTGSLNLTKDGTGSANASTSKTTTSRDFTNKRLSIFIYVKDAPMLAKLAVSSCLAIRYGSDSSNYYQWNFDNSELAVGQNRVEGLTSANADSTTGTPVITACDYAFIQATATGSGITWSAGDLIMDNINVESGVLMTHNTLSSITKTDDIQLYLDTEIQITVEEI